MTSHLTPLWIETLLDGIGLQKEVNFEELEFQEDDAEVVVSDEDLISKDSYLEPEKLVETAMEEGDEDVTQTSIPNPKL